MSLHAGQEIEFHDEIMAGQTYTITSRVADVYEKTGRSGPMEIIVRESTITDAEGRTIVTIRERQIVALAGKENLIYSVARSRLSRPRPAENALVSRHQPMALQRGCHDEPVCRVGVEINQAGAMMSPRISILPLSMPKRLLGFFRYGTSRETGRPFLVMMISSPLAATSSHQLQTLCLELRRLHRPEGRYLVASSPQILSLSLLRMWP